MPQFAEPSRRRAVLPAIVLLAAVTGTAVGVPAHAQAVEPAVVTVRVLRAVDAEADDPDDAAEARPVAGAAVRTLDRTPAEGGLTDAAGVVVLRLAPGARVLLVSRSGFVADTVRLALRAGGDTTVVSRLHPAGAELETVIVAATRSARRVEDEPLRIEVIGAEEVEEKLLMSPGDVAMLLNETSGLRVQTTSPSLGAANVRVQGLPGRYTLLLTDGLPLGGVQAGALSLMQIPPIDLARVEVLKGAATALYGPSALGGVINFVTRRPTPDAAGDLLLNATSQGAADAVGFASGPLRGAWGYTMLGGVHRQRLTDVDADGWGDLPGFERVVARPRLTWDPGDGRSALLTAGFTGEQRDGGTLEGAVAPDGGPFAEELQTRRADVAASAQAVIGQRAIVAARGVAVEQAHEHRFGAVRERDRHRTLFGEATVTLPAERLALVGGVAIQQDRYRARDVAGFDYTFTAPGLFVQADARPLPWLSIAGTGRVDDHSEYGALVSPRVSALVRMPDAGALHAWTARVSLAGGATAPTPLTDETEASGLARLTPFARARPERVRAATFDLAGLLTTPGGDVELVLTAFASRVTDALQVRPDPATSADPDGGRLTLVTAVAPVRTGGAEFSARYAAEPWHVTASWAWLRSTEPDPITGVRRDVPLTPRQAGGLVVMWESHETARIGVELYHVGRQALEDNPFRATSPSYVILGLLAERRVGPVRLFVNGENLGDTRLTRTHSLVRPDRGPGGRWTTDAWAPLEGRVINGGMRFSW